MTPQIEAMLAAILRQLAGVKTIAVGAASPLPGTAALLARRLMGARVLLLGSLKNNDFTDGGRELFDCAAQGRIDAFFLSGAQIDGQANINLVGTGTYPRWDQRFPGSFGSAYLYFLVPRVILFREEHSRRSLVPKVDFISAPGISAPEVYRPGGPVALVTGRCVFSFEKGVFRLASLHRGETLESIASNTGFTYEVPAEVPETEGLTEAAREVLTRDVKGEIAEIYPRFATLL